MDILIRQAAVSDSEAIARLSENSLGYPSCAKTVQGNLQKLDDKREAVFCAESGGAVVGYVHVELYGSLFIKPTANLLALAVDMSFQRHGAGALLLAAAESWAHDNGAEQMRVNSGSTRTEAHKFYGAMGYDCTKQQMRFLKDI